MRSIFYSFPNIILHLFHSVWPLMNLTELKKKPIGELIKIAEFMGLEGMARNRKQDIIFAILKRHAMNGEEIFGDGVLEILSDGFGFQAKHADDLKGANAKIDVKGGILTLCNFLCGFGIQGSKLLEYVIANLLHPRAGG